MGITSPLDALPSIGLGALRLGVSPLEMAHAYATLANDGARIGGSVAFRTPEPGEQYDPSADPISITKVIAPNGKVIAEQRSRDAAGRVARDRPRDRLDPAVGDPLRHGEDDQGIPAAGVRQDRHDLELRRCLVRGRDAPARHGGLGRLREPRDSDAQAVQGHAGVRRHDPGDHLVPVRAASTRRAAGPLVRPAVAAGSRGRADRYGERASRDPIVSPRAHGGAGARQGAGRLLALQRDDRPDARPHRHVPEERETPDRPQRARAAPLDDRHRRRQRSQDAWSRRSQAHPSRPRSAGSCTSTSRARCCT